MTATGKTLDTSWLAKIEEDLKVRYLLPLGENFTVFNLFDLLVFRFVIRSQLAQA